MRKICTKCKVEKETTEFYKRTISPDGLRPNCKLCQKEIDKQYRLENREKLLKYDQDRSQHTERKEVHRKACNKYDRSHKEKIKEHKLERYRNEVRFKLMVILRRRLTCILKRKTKTGSAVRDLGCTIDELKLYLESKFYPNPQTGEMMTWENYKKDNWQIDHIRPLALFNFEDREELLKAVNYTNLQPLWVSDHKEKTIKDMKEIRNANQ